MVREFRSRRAWRAAQGHHAFQEHGGEQGALSLVPFFARTKKGTGSGAADVVPAQEDRPAAQPMSYGNVHQSQCDRCNRNKSAAGEATSSGAADVV